VQGCLMMINGLAVLNNERFLEKSEHLKFPAKSAMFMPARSKYHNNFMKELRVQIWKPPN
jgi:hypothetical protein